MCRIKKRTSCNHNDEKRLLTWTWVTDELKKAVKKGYAIKMYEVWYFDEIAMYDPVTKSGGLFTDYVNTFYQLKHEASVDLAGVFQRKLSKKYIGDCYQNRRHQPYDNIKKNSGLRALAKLLSNSFWEKFGQRANMTQLYPC